MYSARETVPSAFSYPRARRRGASYAICIRHSEMPANLLIGLRSDLRTFSEFALTDKANHLDFDSAIPRFESWRPSQPVLSLWAISELQK
jgi:hypothetical protein